MSGFAGIISLDGAPPDTRLLERMAQTLAFRGPDGTHISVKPGAGFCFTFLRTGPAPQCPSQPCSLDGNVWLLGDVRLDGRDDLRRKLEQHGDEIEEDATDEELILRTWRRWGEEGIAEIIGDYAFALWDAEHRRLRCWRDLMGARPFFYAQVDDRLYFSNTLAAIQCAPAISRELDHDFIGDFLLEGWCLDESRTAFRDILRLRAGHILRYSRGESEVRRYKSLPIEEPLWFKREEEYVERFGMLLEQAVHDRLPHRRLAVFMSGGLDSTSIAAFGAKCGKKSSPALDLRAFTMDYRPVFDSGERLLASLAAGHIGVPIEILSGASYLPYGGWNESPPHMPEPCHEPYHAVQIHQFSQAAKHSRIALNGYGGDGVMSGQSWPYLAWLFRRWQFAKIVSVFGGYILKNGRIPPLRAGLRAALRKWLKAFQGNDSINAYPPWLTLEFENELRLRRTGGKPALVEKKAHPWYPIDFDTLNGSWAGVLELEDAAWTGVPMESRAPFLDLRVQRFLMQVPPVPLCVGKEILRRVIKGLLPEEVRLRPKTPFRGDVISLQMASGRWKPLPIPEPNDEIRGFVDWSRLEARLKSGEPDSLWANLRPVSLIYWLKMRHRGERPL